MAMPEEVLLSPEEAAIYLGIKKGTLDNWRSNRRVEIPYIKLGTNVRYEKADLDAFIAANKQGGKNV